MMQPKYGPEAPVPITQLESEFTKLLQLYEIMSPKNVLEIGTHYGGSLYHWITKGRDDATIVSVDNYQINEGLYNQWKKPNQNIVSIRGLSQDQNVIDVVKNYAPFQFIFIDGGHTYNEVSNDFRNYRTLIEKDVTTSIIAFHDIAPHPISEVHTLWQQIKNMKVFSTIEFIEDRNKKDGCGIGVIFI